MTAFAPKLYWYALQNRTTGQVEAYAVDANDSNELSKKHKECEGKLFKRGWTLPELERFAIVTTEGTEQFLPPCVGDSDAPGLAANRERDEFSISAPPGSVVFVHSSKTGQLVRAVTIPIVQALIVQSLSTTTEENADAAASK